MQRPPQHVCKNAHRMQTPQIPRARNPRAPFTCGQSKRLMRCSVMTQTQRSFSRRTTTSRAQATVICLRAGQAQCLLQLHVNFDTSALHSGSANARAFSNKSFVEAYPHAARRLHRVQHFCCVNQLWLEVFLTTAACCECIAFNCIMPCTKFSRTVQTMPGCLASKALCKVAAVRMLMPASYLSHASSS